MSPKAIIYQRASTRRAENVGTAEIIIMLVIECAKCQKKKTGKIAINFCSDKY